MIASLRGTVVDKTLDSVVIECAGVGYQCSATPETLAQLPVGQEAFVLTAHVVREDAQLLFAFVTPEERAAFGILQTVSGVAARIALGILSVLSPQEVATAVQQQDVKTLQRANGVGKKLAERMLLELKDKVNELGSGATLSAQSPQAIPDVTSAAVSDIVLEGLVGLGFPEAKAQQATAETLHALMEAGQPIDDASVVLRKALTTLSNKR